MPDSTFPCSNWLSGETDGISDGSNWLSGEIDGICDGSKWLSEKIDGTCDVSKWLRAATNSPSTGSNGHCGMSDSIFDGSNWLFEETNSTPDGSNWLIASAGSTGPSAMADSIFFSSNWLLGETDSTSDGSKWLLSNTKAASTESNGFVVGEANGKSVRSYCSASDEHNLIVETSAEADFCGGGGNCRLFESASGVDLGDSLLGGCVLGDLRSCVEATASCDVRGNGLLLDCEVSDSI